MTPEAEDPKVALGAVLVHATFDLVYLDSRVARVAGFTVIY